MEACKPIFLISNSVNVKPEGIQGYYNSQLMMKVISETDDTPLVLSDKGPPTHSKTFQAPVDDDPDPDREKCY